MTSLLGAARDPLASGAKEVRENRCVEHCSRWTRSCPRTGGALERLGAHTNGESRRGSRDTLTSDNNAYSLLSNDLASPPAGGARQFPVHGEA